MDCDHFSNILFPHPKEAPYEIRAKLAQQLQRRSRLKMLTDERSDDGRKVITIAHPEHSSGELKTYIVGTLWKGFGMVHCTSNDGKELLMRI